MSVSTSDYDRLCVWWCVRCCSFDSDVLDSCILERGLMTAPTIAYNDDPAGDIIHQPYTAHNQGFEAFQLGHAKRENPYKSGTREHEYWDDGWRHGYLEELHG